MKQILLVSAAVVALSVPAMAASPQQQGANGNKASAQQSQRINPMELSQQQVRSIQRELDAKGFRAGRADGIWGRETAAAVRAFQQRNKLEGNGHLTRTTLADLGVQQQNGKAVRGAANGQANGQAQNAQNAKTSMMKRNAQNQSSTKKSTVGAGPSSTNGMGSGNAMKPNSSQPQTQQPTTTKK